MEALRSTNLFPGEVTLQLWKANSVGILTVQVAPNLTMTTPAQIIGVALCVLEIRNLVF